MIPPFEAFLGEHRTLVYRFLLAAAGPQDADDCFQETFLSALRAYSSLRDGRNLRAWVLQIAANKAVDAGRSRARRAVPIDDVSAAAVGRGDGSGPRDQAAEGIGIDPGDPLWRAVRSLPDHQRTAVVLRSVLDRPYAEVAAVLGGSEETARAHVYQGLKKLRRELGDTSDVNDVNDVVEGAER
jgi:RNA polymerase sigma factor (sigma-70 family)